MPRKGTWLVGILSLITILYFFSCCDNPPLRSKSVESLMRSEDYVFEPVVKGDGVRFPQDFSSHPNYQSEWWYFAANLQSDCGDDIAVQWTLFRMATNDEDESGWKTPQMYMAHMVVTKDKKTWRAERFARGGIGQAGVMATPFRAWLDNWRWQAQGSSPFPGRLTFADNSVDAILNVEQVGAIVLQGDGGYSRKHPLLDIASYYYSAPFLSVQGMLELDGEIYHVKGKGWFDREWSSNLLSKAQQGWDWFSLHLDDGSALMVSQLREKGSKPYFLGSRAWPNGKVVKLDNNQIRMEPIKSYKIQGKDFPLRWKITIPSQAIDIETDVKRRDQWLPFVFPYWEGAIRATGSHQGKGFMELIGYELQ